MLNPIYVPIERVKRSKFQKESSILFLIISFNCKMIFLTLIRKNILLLPVFSVLLFTFLNPYPPPLVYTYKLLEDSEITKK